MSEAVLSTFDAESGIARLRFNRAEVLNAVDPTLAEGLHAAVRGLSDFDGLRCVVLTGEGRAFMAGGDIAGLAGTTAHTRAVFNRLIDAMNPALVALRQLDAPILAGVRGVAAGAGLSLALTADIVLAETGTQFLFAYERIGAVSDCGGSWLLPRKIGMGRAAEMMMLSRALSAEEARDWGIVTEVAEKDGFEARLDALAMQLASGPGRSFGALRRLMDSGFTAPHAAHLETERAAFLDIVATEDFAEGTTAFLEKRNPRFKGR